MKNESAGRALPTMLQVLPAMAREMALELELSLGDGGARTRLKLGGALAAAAYLRDVELWKAISMDANALGEGAVVPLALEAALKFAHPGEGAPPDATTRVLRLALARAFQGERRAEAAQDPLVDDCARVIGIVHALSIARTIDSTGEDRDRAQSFLRMAPPPPMRNQISSHPEIIESSPPSARGRSDNPSPKPPRVDSVRPDRNDSKRRGSDPRFESTRPPPSQRAPAKQSEVPASGPRGASNGTRVLVVDDDDGYRKLLGRMLSPLEVVFASTGASALEILAAAPDFEVVLTKSELPGVSGADLLDTVKEKWPYLTSRVIFVSAAGTAPEGHILLRKPISRDSLLHAIARVSKKIAELQRQR